MTLSVRPASFLSVVAAALVVALPSCDSTTGPRYASEFTLVELDPAAPGPLQLAVQACAGLNNRELGGSVYVRMDDHDTQWLTELDLTPSRTVTAQEFLNECVTEFPSCVRYDYTDQQKLLPNVLTVAAALEAVPLDTGMDVACNDVAFDATVELADDTPYLATEYVFQNYIDQTTGLAMLNPGYQLDAADTANPPIDRDMSSALVDYVFSRKLFVVFLVNGCIDSDPEKALLSEIVNSGQWETPLGVYGYNNSWLVAGGFLYEAQTRCLDSRNMGAIPSERHNLSFFSTRRAPITSTNELEHNAPDDVQYDPSKTYVAFVVGDGDNINFMVTWRKSWVRSRLADCAQPDSSCAPLTWTISPHLPTLAPDVLAWYYASLSQTGSDYFMLPPSGHLYAYPASMNEADQDRFVSLTEQDARILGTQSTVDWEWSATWAEAESDFLPKYASAGGPIRGIFPVNVPYLISAFTWWPADQYAKVLTGGDGGNAVVFRPRSWRGVDGSDTEFFATPQAMADNLEALPPGTVTWVYMTSDGGLSLDNAFIPLVELLPSHIQLVSADTAAQLALVADGG